MFCSNNNSCWIWILLILFILFWSCGGCGFGNSCGGNNCCSGGCGSNCNCNCNCSCNNGCDNCGCC